MPFNKGDHGGAGNPPSPSGHRTSYLWEEVWERESFLDILGRYLVTEKDDKKKLTRYLFPRYHQLDATRKLLNAVKAEGAGGKYLIQHSAGSGKTNSIAWTAHFFADLHDADHKKVFDSVIVVSDRNVIDQQLQDAIFDFQRTTGVVTSIKGASGSKSKELAEALSGDKKIVVCTIQTFPFALEKVRELAASDGKRFAVIADEAHSSQTGEAAAKLKQVLSAEEWQEIEDGGEVGFDDVLRAQMTARTADTGITYVAFTATPKAKTLELFGRKPEPDQPAGPTNVPEAFHVYSMRQAIEEGFILDVLENYTTYKLAFRLAHDGKEYDETEVERATAMKGIMRWVRLHPYNISQKVQVVVEHYLENVQPLLEGHAKAMVVVGSRLEAVRWQLAMQKYIQSRGYRLSALVAFSGEVNDKASGEDPFTENSQVLNPFSGLGVMGLSRLSLSWVRLGIVHERIQPGKPQQNGRHERMHRTLKQDTTNPSAKTLHAQQKRFDEFVRVYNHERPHEALGNETPGSIYVPSSRLLPRYTKAHQYPAHFQTRRVNDAGDISWHKSRVFISEVFRGEDIALEKVEENFYRVYFCSLEVGEFNVDDMRFRPGLRP